MGNAGPNVLAMNMLLGILIGMTITDNTNANALMYGNSNWYIWA